MSPIVAEVVTVAEFIDKIGLLHSPEGGLGVLVHVSDLRKGEDSGQ